MKVVNFIYQNENEELEEVLGRVKEENAKEIVIHKEDNTIETYQKERIAEWI